MFKTTEYVYGEGRLITVVWRTPHDLPDADVSLKQLYALQQKEVPWGEIASLIEKTRPIHEVVVEQIKQRMSDWTYSGYDHFCDYCLRPEFEKRKLSFRFLSRNGTSVHMLFNEPERKLQGSLELSHSWS